MNINILDPCTRQRITVWVPRKPRPDHQVRRQVLRQLDRSDVARWNSTGLVSGTSREGAMDAHAADLESFGNGTGAVSLLVHRFHLGNRH